MKGPIMTKSKALKVSRLLNMLYKPAEIAKELEITVDTIYRSYLPSGAPCMKDSKGNVWIHGEAFARWARTYLDIRPQMGRARVTKEKMQDNQVYCLHCNEVVVPEILRTGRPNGRGVANMQGKCPQCGKRVNRFIRIEPAKSMRVENG
jgi:phage FluMu protein Com